MIISKLLKKMLLLCLLLTNLSYAANNDNNIILFVWDGLRPDAVTPYTTPHLYQLAQQGIFFNDHHASFPTFTMMNASTFATGNFAGKAGFYGNTLWNNKTTGKDSADKSVDFQQPVFTEDYKILADLNHQEPLIEVYTLFNQAHKKGIVTATIGKSGPAYFQDYHQEGIIFDEKHVYPENFAHYLKSMDYPLPANIIYRYKNFKLMPHNGNPTAADPVVTLSDSLTSDPTQGTTSPYNASNAYLMQSYLKHILPKYHPNLSVIWLRNPDSSEHTYGVGTEAYYHALHQQDQLLGQLIHRLKATQQWTHTNIIIVSDHGHSNVSGSLSQFPLRQIKDGKVTQIDNLHGYSVSGDFRPADLLNRAGFKAYDGMGCWYDPVLSGITKNDKPIYPTFIDKSGNICGTPETQYNSPAYKVPTHLPEDAIIVAGNGGSTYFYVPSHDLSLVKKLVRYCQSRQEFDAVFLDARYGDIPGTLKLETIKLQNDQGRNPDVIVSSAYDDKERIQGVAGIEFNSSGRYRGMHGSFSPIDVHNTLITYGPDFKTHYIDQLPTGNVDVAPTIAYLLGLTFEQTDGRVLYEALSNKHHTDNADAYQVKMYSYTAKNPATHIIMQLATSPDGKDIDNTISHYNLIVQLKSLQQDDKEYHYFDSARGIRY